MNDHGSSALYVSHTAFTLAYFAFLSWSLLVYFRSSNLLNDEQFAAVLGDVGLCRFLLEQGADPLFENQYHTYAVFDALVVRVD